MKIINLKMILKLFKLKLDEQKIKFSKASKMKNYYKGKCEQQVEKANEAKSTLKNSEKNVDNLQKQVDRLQDIVKENRLEKLELFDGGKYKTEIRQVYIDLLSSGVSIEKCSTVVRSVLDNLLNVQVDRLYYSCRSTNLITSSSC